MKQIFHSLEEIDPNIAAGIGWHNHEEKRAFIENLV
jgi:hypothetical protein